MSPQIPLGTQHSGSPLNIFLSPQIQFININAGNANSVVAEMVYLCTNSVVDPICRDLRAFGGTSLDHKFLVGGLKSIYRAGLLGTLGVLLGTLGVLLGILRYI